MIQNSFTRPIGPISIGITLLVIVLHGLTMWALVSMDSPERPEIKRVEPELIQLELVTLDTLPTEKLTIKPKQEIQLESKAAPQPKPQLEEKVDAPVAKAKPAPNPVKQPDIVKSPKPEIEQLDSAKEELEIVKEEPKLDKELKASVPVQKPVIKKPEEATKKSVKKEQSLASSIEAETKEFNLKQEHLPAQELAVESSKNTSNATAEKEQSLAELIRAVTKQHNFEQAEQQRAAKKQAEDRLQVQAIKSEVEQDQAVKQKTAPIDVDKETAASNKPVNFLAEQAGWLDDHKPNTNLPLLVWNSTTARSGDVFRVLLELHVDKNGHITEVQLLESSGNQVIDAAATVQVRTGRLEPLLKNGLPVNGIVPMSLSYEMP